MKQIMSKKEKDMSISHNTRSEKNTVKELAQLAKKKINPNPIGQRPPVSVGYNKSKGIIDSLLKGFSIGEITLRDIREDALNQKIYKGCDFLVIDGGHRLRAIRDFYDFRFAVNGKFYSDLSPEDMDKLDAIVINITEYTCNNKEATEIFRRLNTVTPVNQIEMIMSNDTSPFAKYIRSRTSVVNEYNNDPHQLFSTISKDGGKVKPVHWNGDANPRRKWDEYVGVIALKIVGGGNTNAGLEILEKTVEEDTELSKEKLKTIDKILTDILNVRTAGSGKRKIKLNGDTFAALQVVLFQLYEESRYFKITDYDMFAKKFYKAHANLTGIRPNPELDEEFRTFRTSETTTAKRLVKEFARLAIKNFANPTQQREVAHLYLQFMDYSDLKDYVSFRQEQRTVSLERKSEMLSLQDYKCAIDGKPLNLDDAIFGHDTPWSLGGKASDAKIIRSTHNRDMGTMTINEYKVFLKMKGELV